MKAKSILATSIALALSHFASADPAIPAEPVTISAAVGNEQSDFFYAQSRKGQFVVFSGALPIKKNTVDETRTFFSVKIGNGLSTYYSQAVPKISPLTKLIGFKVPVGTVFDNFIYSPVQDTFTTREIFHVPTKGLYMSTSGGVPKLVHVETATDPITGATVRFGDPASTEPDEDQQFRIIFGATFPKKGSEPFQSTGSAAASKLLSDIDPGKNISSNPQQFTIYNHEAYFVATDPGNNPSVYKVAVNTSRRTPVYSAAEVTAGGLASAPSNLTGCDSGLFFTSTNAGASDSLLYIYDPNSTQFEAVPNNGDSNFPSSASIFDAAQLTPSVDTLDVTMAFSAFDSNTNETRLGIFYPGGGGASFVELENHDTAYPTSNPTLITSAGDYVFFSALYSGAGPYLNKVFTGDPEGDEFVFAVTDGNYITNAQEIVYAGLNGGTVYFTADAVVNNVSQTGILFSIVDPTAEPTIAVPVRTVNNNLVQGAHNLRSVTQDNVFRLYFTAPVSPTVNSEYSVDAKGNPDNIDHGTKPWVVNVGG